MKNIKIKRAIHKEQVYIYISMYTQKSNMLTNCKVNPAVNTDVEKAKYFQEQKWPNTEFLYIAKAWKQSTNHKFGFPNQRKSKQSYWNAYVVHVDSSWGRCCWVCWAWSSPSCLWKYRVAATVALRVNWRYCAGLPRWRVCSWRWRVGVGSGCVAWVGGCGWIGFGATTQCGGLGGGGEGHCVGIRPVKENQSNQPKKIQRLLQKLFRFQDWHVPPVLLLFFYRFTCKKQQIPWNK